MSESLCVQAEVNKSLPVQAEVNESLPVQAEIQNSLQTEVQSDLKRCPFCSEIILSDAKKCKHCQEFLDPEQRASAVPQLKWSPALAAALSLVVPGGGQIYRGKVITGFLWALLVAMGYSLYILPGIILHLVCISFAAIGNPLKE
jgi:TM2 domain-containing membrane protein YozV